MSIQYLETNVISAYLADAWQNELQTEMDPTAGRWYRQGPNNSVGLFGGLTDILVTDLTFDVGQANVNKSRDITLTTTIDNRQGLLSESPSTNTLQWQITNSTTTSHRSTNSVKSTLLEKISVKGKIGPVEATSETNFGLEYAYSWTDTSAVTVSETKAVNTAISIKVPAGKAYKLVVLADKNSLTIPYHARIRIKGTSEANFEHTVGGKNQYSASAGTVCNWIKKHGSAKGDEMEFDADPANLADGLASIKGLLRADQAVHFTVFAIDVTSTLTADPSSAGTINKLLKGERPSEVVISQPVQA